MKIIPNRIINEPFLLPLLLPTLIPEHDIIVPFPFHFARASYGGEERVSGHGDGGGCGFGFEGLFFTEGEGGC